MDVFEAIQKRRSIRSYEDTSVPKETLTKLLEAARMAPSAKRVQPWHFVVVTNEKKREQLSKGIYAKWLHTAPVVIAACGDAKASQKWYMVDVALALENMALAAVGEGLGTCFVGSFEEDDVKKVLGIPQEMRVVALLAVGYPKEKESITSKVFNFLSTKRKAFEDIVSYETYGASPTKNS
jgi:nitroreductase